MRPEAEERARHVGTVIYVAVSMSQPGNNSVVLLELTVAWFQHSEVFMDHSVLSVDYF